MKQNVDIVTLGEMSYWTWLESFRECLLKV